MAAGLHNPSTAPATVPAALRALLSGLIDYAGLFPPAKLSLRDAAEKFVRYSRGPHAWMLGKFVLPASQLSEFRDTVTGIPEAFGFTYTLSALLGNEPVRDAREIRAEINHQNGAGSRPFSIEAIEFRPGSPSMVAEVSALLPKGLPVFCEVPPLENLADWLRAIREAGAFAKIRTGGVTLASFPPSAVVADFILECKAHGVGFKATAGLHHPVRSKNPLTYEIDSVCGVMHGFLNVFVGAALAGECASKEQLVQILDEGQADSFRVSVETLEWHGVQVSATDVARTREHFAISFGSCSFEEPIQDLQKLGLL